jgi:hypothetical protein
MVPIGPEDFPDQSFDPVTTYRSTNLALNTDPQPIHRQAITMVNDGKALAMNTPSVPVYPIELPIRL